MLIAIATTQIIADKTVVRNEDGTLTAIRKLFGIVPDSLSASMAAKANRGQLAAAKASGSLDDLLAAQQSVVRTFDNIAVSADAVLTARATESHGGVEYHAVHAGTLYCEVDEAFVEHFPSRESRKAAQDAARKAGA